jgi:hypothetical protein
MKTKSENDGQYGGYRIVTIATNNETKQSIMFVSREIYKTHSAANDALNFRVIDEMNNTGVYDVVGRTIAIIENKI